MITLFRAIRLWQLRTKYRLALWQFIDQQAKELLKNPEEIEKKIIYRHTIRSFGKRKLNNNS